MDIEQFDIPAFQAGDPTVFLQVCENYNQRLSYFVRKYIGDDPEAKDIVASTFAKLWENRAKFTSRDFIKNFLFKVAYNECMTHLKAKKFNSSMLSNWASQSNGFDYQYHGTILQADICAWLRERFQVLTKDQRLVMTELWINDKSEEEVSELYGKTVNSIRSLKSQAIARMKIKWTEFLLIACSLSTMLMELSSVAHPVFWIGFQ